MEQAETLNPNDLMDKAAAAAALLKSMANEHRLMVLCRLGAGEMSVAALQEGSGLSQSALSQHLAVLRAHDLVATRRESQTIHYRIADPAVLSIIATLTSAFCPETSA